jgi:TonB family protein
MINSHINPTSKPITRWGTMLAQTAALALLLAFCLPSGAEDRAVKSRVAPVYPEIAKRMRIEGVIVMTVTVDAEGKVTDVKTISGNRTLSIAAEDAVRKWRFVPGTAGDTVQVSMNFALQ